MGFFHIFKNIGKFNYKSDLCTIGWMEKIVINEALMFLRKKLVYNNPCHAENVEYMTGGQSDDNLIAEDYYKLIMRLPCVLRTVFNLYAIDGFSHKEIAGELGIEEESSRVYLSRARKMLQGYLSVKLLCYERK
jgi:RNA polymerase sigma-70 factor (ECF subfamily)